MTHSSVDAPAASPRWSARSVSAALPDFPWDRLTRYAERARAHAGGIVDLSIGTPVDSTPEVVQQALAAAADAPGYPLTIGRADTRQACVDWLSRRFGVTGVGVDAVLPVIGSKELIASLPTHLGLGAGDVVVQPELAYPTYEVGAVLAGARVVATDALTSVGPERVSVVWVNSPSNPTGRVLPAEHLRKVVDWCRERGTLLVSDECYLEFAWETATGSEPVSVLHPDVCGSDHTGVLAVHSLSKRSNLAGYRCAFVAGDPQVVAELLAVRKNLGLQMPAPQQQAMRVALDDDGHVREQHARYARRRRRCCGRPSRVPASGWTTRRRRCTCGLTRDEPCWDTVGRLADQGILVAPGEFYGAAGARHVRVAFTATDERVEAAVGRLGG